MGQTVCDFAEACFCLLQRAKKHVVAHQHVDGHCTGTEVNMHHMARQHAAVTWRPAAHEPLMLRAFQESWGEPPVLLILAPCKYLQDRTEAQSHCRCVCVSPFDRRTRRTRRWCCGPSRYPAGRPCVPNFNPWQTPSMPGQALNCKRSRFGTLPGSVHSCTTHFSHALLKSESGCTEVYGGMSAFIEGTLMSSNVTHLVQRQPLLFSNQGIGVC